MTHRVLVFTLGAVLVAGFAPAAAQTSAATASTPRRSLGFLTADGGMQVTSTSTSSTVTYKVYGEDARMDSTYETKAARVFGARGAVRVWRGLTVGAGVSVFKDDTGAKVAAKLPHPFFFQRPRDADGTASGITRDEVVVYGEIGWTLPVGAKVDLMVFAGPAFFNAKQDVATKVRYTESYPFDTAQFADVESVSKDPKATGFTVGADVSYRVTNNFGLGALIRFSRATVDVSPVTGQTFTLDLGGLQTLAGVRIRF